MTGEKKAIFPTYIYVYIKDSFFQIHNIGGKNNMYVFM